MVRQSRINDFRTGEVEIQSVADLDRKLRLRFTLTHAGEVDVSGAFREYTERGTTLTRPFEATQVRNILTVITTKGSSIKYIRVEGRGVSKNGQFLRTTVLIGCVKSVKGGGRGSKKPEICAST